MCIIQKPYKPYTSHASNWWFSFFSQLHSTHRPYLCDAQFYVRNEREKKKTADLTHSTKNSLILAFRQRFVSRVASKKGYSSQAFLSFHSHMLIRSKTSWQWFIHYRHDWTTKHQSILLCSFYSKCFRRFDQIYIGRRSVDVSQSQTSIARTRLIYSIRRVFFYGHMGTIEKWKKKWERCDKAKVQFRQHRHCHTNKKNRNTFTIESKCPTIHHNWTNVNRQNRSCFYPKMLKCLLRAVLRSLSLGDSWTNRSHI